MQDSHTLPAIEAPQGWMQAWGCYIL